MVAKQQIRPFKLEISLSLTSLLCIAVLFCAFLYQFIIFVVNFFVVAPSGTSGSIIYYLGHFGCALDRGLYLSFIKGVWDEHTDKLNVTTPIIIGSLSLQYRLLGSMLYPDYCTGGHSSTSEYWGRGSVSCVQTFR